MSDGEILVPDDLTVHTADEQSAQPDSKASETGTEETTASTEQVEPTTDEQDPDKDPDKKTGKMPWEQRAINRLNREKWEARRQAEDATKRADQLSAELAAYRGGQTAENANPQYSQQDVETRAQAIAREIASADSFNQASNRTYQAGKSEYPDFDATLENLRMLDVMRPDIVQVVLDAAGADAHKALYELGKDPDEAERILNLPPIRMAAAIAKLTSAKPEAAKPPPPISKAPAPIRPISGSANVEGDESRLSDDEWWRRENKRKG